jgi:hypothetical protein
VPSRHSCKYLISLALHIANVVLKCNLFQENRGNRMRDKQQKFIDIAEKRVNRLLREIRLVGNLSNRNNYVYEQDDVAKIFGAIEAELRTTKKKFDVALASVEKGFKLR